MLPIDARREQTRAPEQTREEAFDIPASSEPARGSAARRPAWLPHDVWPFETTTIRVGGCDLSMTDVGRGPILLFVHTGLWSFIWRDLLLRLSQEYRCVCFDSPGTGLSSRLPTSEITLEAAASSVAGIIRSLDLRDYALVVHDLGGIAGIAGASEMPQRVRGLVAVNAFAWRPTGRIFRAALAFFGSLPVRELDALTGIVPRITATAFGIGRHLDAAARRAFLAGVEPGARRAFHAYLRDARRCDPLYEQIGLSLAGPLQRLPALTIFGERNDPFGFQARWKTIFPRAEQLVIPRGNHFPLCDAPETVAQAIDSWYKRQVTLDGTSGTTYREYSRAE